MPKTRTDTWQTCAAPQTPLQRSAFLDLCTHWLVREPPATDEVPWLDPRTTWTATCASRAPSIGLTQSDLRLEQSRACAFCETAAGIRPVVANPFTQRPLVMACAACLARLER